MNKSTMLLIALILNILSFTASANTLSYSISVKKSTVIVNFSAVTQGEKVVKVEVLDDEGNEYKEVNFVVTTDKVEKIDLSSLEKGFYTFRMSFEDKVINREFKLSKSKRISMRDYTMRSSNRGIIVSFQGNIIKVETTNLLTENVSVVFRSDDGLDDLLYKASFIPGENSITNIDLRNLEVSQFILDVEANNVTYSEKITMF
ncbi:hypothetical protein [Flammeovirga aprica]|uniref:T9SS type A sorting domain-containing protein n=1 Tax=Flammeovirga aprica JL-4 TaxID=694437 RepID=A0A7X9P2K1_9BACT|nr:hypothetical protein [Flammeovirga aprica]NME68260.1 hypothetical protein [Flammeovirga aprica JL-4]